MKKLESLKSFLNNEIHEKQMSKINGGAKPDTEGGCFETVGTNTGYMAFTHDTWHRNENGELTGAVIRQGTSEILKDDCRID